MWIMVLQALLEVRKEEIRSNHGPPGSSGSEKGRDKKQCLNISSFNAHNNCMAGVGGRVLGRS